MRRGAALLLVALALIAVLGACGPPKKGPPFPNPLPLETTFGPPMPAERTEVAGAHWEDEGLIAVAGGYAANGQPTNDLFLYNTFTGAWSSGRDLPGNYDHSSLAFLNGRLWLVGGNKDGAPTDEVWRLDTPNGTWQAADSLSTPRSALATVAVEGKLVATGGFNGVTQLASTEIFDPATGSWTAGPNMAIAREHHGAAAYFDRVYVMGGRAPTNLASVEVMNIGGGGFVPDPDLQFSRSGNAAAANYGGMPCTGGGEEAAGTIGSIECRAQIGWAHYANLWQPRHGLAMVAVGHQMHFIAGGPSPGLTVSATHEILFLSVAF